MPRHIDQNGVTDALLIISILKQIPTSRWISGPQIQQNLSELGIEIEARRMQRLLKSIRDCEQLHVDCLLYTSPSPRDTERSRMPSSA